MEHFCQDLDLNQYLPSQKLRNGTLTSLRSFLCDTDWVKFAKDVNPYPLLPASEVKAHRISSLCCIVPGRRAEHIDLSNVSCRPSLNSNQQCLLHGRTNFSRILLKWPNIVYRF